MREVEYDDRMAVTAITLTCDFCGAVRDVVTAQAEGWGIVVRNLDATTEQDICDTCLGAVARARAGAGVP